MYGDSLGNAEWTLVAGGYKCIARRWPERENCLTESPAGRADRLVISAIASDMPASDVLRASVPHVRMAIVRLIILSIFPDIAIWLPDHLMGVAAGAK